MRCLSCWKDIRDKVGIYTKSCKHIFCKPCSEKAFKKELACPLCDTVLAKDGFGEIVVNPDDNDLTRAGAKIFGFEPQDMCHVLQIGLDFWAKQKHNEFIKHTKDMSSTQKKLEDANQQNTKLLNTLDEERLRKKSLQLEKDSLKTIISELESRYAEKARSLRKLSELYNELRQVHRRLEHDLRGVHDKREYDRLGEDGDHLRKSAIEEVKTVVQSDNRGAWTAEEVIARETARPEPPVETHRYPHDDNYTPYDHRQHRDERGEHRRRHASSRVNLSNSEHRGATSTPGENMFAIAQNRRQTSDGSDGDDVIRRSADRSARRRERRRESDLSIDYNDKDHRLTRPRGGH